MKKIIGIINRLAMYPIGLIGALVLLLVLISDSIDEWSKK